jgi:5'-phosphate synthase pdxT subunit
MFVEMVRERAGKAPEQLPPNPFEHLGRLPNRPADMPAYGKEFMSRE